LTSIEELADLGSRQVNAPAYPRENRIAMTVATSEVSTNPAFNGFGQQAGYQIRQIVDVVVHDGVESAPDSREV
jgi:hypothetical protein